MSTRTILTYGRHLLRHRARGDRIRVLDDDRRRLSGVRAPTETRQTRRLGAVLPAPIDERKKAAGIRIAASGIADLAREPNKRSPRKFLETAGSA
jgi:hypothetical protein